MKQIVLLAETQGTADYVSHQLDEIFSPYASLSVVIADPALPPLSASLVVIVSKVLEDQMQKYIRPGTRVLIADRMMDPCEASRLYEIPPGSDVLVVNTSPKVTEESISQLIACGIDGLRYHAYYPGVSSYPQNCSFAVTFGESHLIPPGNYCSVLDLHSRPIGISTCVRIADELGIYDQLRETLSSLYMNPLVRTTRDLALTGSRNLQMSENLRNIINLVQDGLIILDKDSNITYYNETASRILKIRDGASPILDRLLKDHPASGDFFHRLQGSNYYFELIHSGLHRENSATLMIRDVEKVEHIENSYRRTLAEKGLVAHYHFSDIIYRSHVMEALVRMAEKFARGDSTIFIHGPSGCGKELLAQAIHNASCRREQPFVAINFAAISSSLSESELFGYEEGAFTGAKRGGKRGMFQMAHGGTIFLDEIGDAPLDLQKKLLRVIQERNVLPVGGSKLIPVDVRIIAASNQNMDALISSRQFREDLYYRLNVLPLYIPPLHKRREDIIPLFRHFLQSEFNAPVGKLTREVREVLECCPWRGNVRQLRNTAEYIANLASWEPEWESQMFSELQHLLHHDAGENVILPEPTSVKDSPGQVFAEIISVLEDRGDLRHFQKLLTILNSPPYRWSRRTATDYLADAAETDEAAPTDSQLKHDFLLLKELGLVSAVTGKGTFIKEKGKKLLYYLNQQKNLLE